MEYLPTAHKNIKPNITIKNDFTMITADSRKITSGGLFLAVQGVQFNGVNFIPMAIENGASIIITHTDTNTDAIPSRIEIIKNDNPRQLFAKIANDFYQPQPAFFGAVTGTNGKTSITNFTQQLWTLCGYNSIALGTMGMTGCGYKPTSSLTTPDPADLHYSLQQAVMDKSVSHACIEASSHGLDMYRLDGVSVKCAGFTNLSRDHLDYHNDMDSYFYAKARLFTEILDTDGLAVLHKNIDAFSVLKAMCDSRNIKTMSYGIDTIKNAQNIDLCITKYQRTATGFNVDISYKDTTISTTVNLAGQFQLENILCALGITFGVCNSDVKNSGITMETLINHLPKIVGVKGRLEHIGTTPNGADIFVDYAHTPDALKTVLKTMRPHAENNLCVVVGCGGDRDSGKRPIMGKLSVDYADVSYITDDNPRTENPDSIRRDVMAGAIGATEIASRENAIKTAVENLQSGDILIVAGKGHEQGQIIGKIVHPFDDGQHIKSALAML